MESAALFREAGVRVGELLGARPPMAADGDGDGRGRSSTCGDVEWREDCEALELTPWPVATRARGGVLRMHCVYNVAFGSPMLLYQLHHRGRGRGQSKEDDEEEVNAETDGSSSNSVRGDACTSWHSPGLAAVTVVDHPALGDQWLCLSPCGLISAPPYAYIRTSTLSPPSSTLSDDSFDSQCTPLWLPLAKTMLLLLSAVCRHLPLGLDMADLARAAAALHRLERVIKSG